MRRILVLQVVATSLWSGLAMPPCMAFPTVPEAVARPAVASPAAGTPGAPGDAHAHHAPDAGGGASSHPGGDAPDPSSHPHQEGAPDCGTATVCGSGVVPTLSVAGSPLIVPPAVAPPEAPLASPASTVLSTEPPPPRLPA